MTTLRIFGDLGGSGTKAFFYDGFARALQMPPQVALINPSRLSRMTMGGVIDASPEESAYVGVGDATYAVGKLGQLQEGDSGLGLPKRDRSSRPIRCMSAQFQSM